MNYMIPLHNKIDIENLTFCRQTRTIQIDVLIHMNVDLEKNVLLLLVRTFKMP